MITKDSSTVMCCFFWDLISLSRLEIAQFVFTTWGLAVQMVKIVQVPEKTPDLKTHLKFVNGRFVRNGGGYRRLVRMPCNHLAKLLQKIIA
jgi:hypothetical protein